MKTAAEKLTRTTTLEPRHLILFLGMILIIFLQLFV